MENFKTQNSNKIMIKVFSEIELDWNIESHPLNCIDDARETILKMVPPTTPLCTSHIKPWWRETQNMTMMIIMISSSHPFFRFEFTFQSIWAYCTDEYGLFRRTGPAAICAPILCVLYYYYCYYCHRTSETLDNNNNAPSAYQYIIIIILCT